MTGSEFMQYGVGLAAPLVSLRLLTGVIAGIKSVLTPATQPNNGNNQPTGKMSNGDLVMALQMSQDMREVVTGLERMRETQLQEAVVNKESQQEMREFIVSNTQALNAIVASSDKSYMKLMEAMLAHDKWERSLVARADLVTSPIRS